MHPLIAAVSNQSVSAIEELLIAGASPNMFDETSGESVLTLAVATGNSPIVRLFLAYGAEPNLPETIAQPLDVAAGRGHTEIVELLLDCDADVDAIDEDGGTALSSAAAGGHLEIVNLLLEAGADVRYKDRYGKRPILYAAEKGHVEIVDVLAPLSTPKDRKQADLLLRLFFQGPRSEKVKTYFAAAERGDVSAVKEYLAEGGAVDVMEEDGRTAVFRAAHRGRLEVLKLLVEYGADMNHIDSYGSYPLATADQLSDNPAYEFVYQHTSEKLRKDWERRVVQAKKMARDRGYL